MDRGLNQFDLNHLFEDLDKALGKGRIEERKLKANDFMLISMDGNGLCTFSHRVHQGLQVKFDWKNKELK